MSQNRPFPRVPASDIRSKLDAAAAESHSQIETRQDSPQPEAPPSSPPSALDPAPEETGNPPASGGGGHWSIQPWQCFPIDNGDVAVFAILPESFASALTAEGENHGFSLGEQLRDLLYRMAEAGYV